jgi:hypothetical protein
MAWSALAAGRLGLFFHLAGASREGQALVHRFHGTTPITPAM